MDPGSVLGMTATGPTGGRAQTWLIDIPAQECVELLVASPFGRLGVIVNGRPHILPVSHIYDRRSGCVVFATRAGTKLRGALDWPWVAFEVDGLDADGEGGWSVLVVGRAEEIADPGEVTRLDEARRLLWPAGRGSHWVRIVPSEITGRRISAVVT